MRAAAPSIEAVVSRFEVWRVGLLLLGTAGVAMPWWWLLDRATPAGRMAWLIAVVASAVAGLSVSALFRSGRPFSICWDSQRWTVKMAGNGWQSGSKAHRSPVTQATGAPMHAEFAGEPSTQGRMTVVMDLGSWMLLRFDHPPEPFNSDAANAPTDVNLQTSDPANRTTTRCRWLPLQRAGLEPQWHALRCALYSRAAPELHASRPLNRRPSA